MPNGTGELDLFLRFICLFSLKTNYFPRNLSEGRGFQRLANISSKKKRKPFKMNGFLLPNFQLLSFETLKVYCFDFIKNLNLN